MKKEFNELVELFKEDLAWICEECFEIAWCNKYTYKEGQRQVKKLIDRYFKFFNTHLHKEGDVQKAWCLLGKLFTVAYNDYAKKKQKQTNGEIVNLSNFKEFKINKGVFLALRQCGGKQTELAKTMGMDRSYLSKTLNANKGTCPMYISRHIRHFFPYITCQDFDTIMVVCSDRVRMCGKLMQDFEERGREISNGYERKRKVN